MKIALAAALAAAALAGPARAGVTDRSAAGFEVVEKATIAAPPAKVWDTLMHPAPCSSPALTDTWASC